MKAEIFAQIVANIIALLIVSPAQSQSRVVINHDLHMGEESYTYFESTKKLFDGDAIETYLTIVSIETSTGSKEKTPVLVQCGDVPTVIGVSDWDGQPKAYKDVLNLSTYPDHASNWMSSIYLYTCHQVNLNKISWEGNTYETIARKFGYTKDFYSEQMEFSLSNFPVLEQAYRQLKNPY
jgi:hypothetical protein